jgi:hypothetical protein
MYPRQTFTDRVGCCYSQKRFSLLVRPDGSDSLDQSDSIIYLLSLV